MEEFSMMIRDLHNNIAINMEFFERNVKKNPNIVYTKLNELSNFVGKRYSLILEIHFPNKDKIFDVSNYGTENLSMVFDKFQKKFQIEREFIKTKALQSFENVQVYDAYMYEGKEGLRIKFEESHGESRIEILPGSLHIWSKVDKSIESYCNWLLENVYNYRKKN